MKKSVSPLFSIIVIVIALALGALYFMVRYRDNKARWIAESRALQAERDRLVRSGRPQAMRKRAREMQMAPHGAAQPGRGQPSPEPGSRLEAP